MLSSPFFRRLFIPYLLVICAAIAAVGFIAGADLRATYLDRTRTALRDQSVYVAELAQDRLAQGPDAVAAVIKRLRKDVDCRITVVRADGTVVADNEAEAGTMENHGDRPEIQQARASGEGFSIRPSSTLHQDLFYFARRMDAGGQTYYVRLAQHVADLDAHLRRLYAGLAFLALGAMAVAGGISYALARRDARPIVELTNFANHLARGDLQRRYLQRETGETAVLADALNAMADSISRLIARTTDDNARLLTILSSMNEGVIAADGQQRILFTNKAAAVQFGFGGTGAPESDVAGQQLWEVVRSDAILKLSRDVLAGAEAPANGNGSGSAAAAPTPARTRRTIHVGPLFGRHLEVTACTFPPGGPPEGLIIVAHDTTQSVQYQELRKEFVANVSHELRTPLSIIKGFAETLRDGAMADPVRGPQFLTTIERHADQLTNLVSDLLELSRLDGQAGVGRRTPVNVAHVVRRVSEMILPAAQRKRHQVTIDVAEDLPDTVGNVDYLDRAVTNLIDNAIKYTPEEGSIHIRAYADRNSVIVEVTDDGIGIPREELPRIFERFYRVDRSRSRELGGTGLGLSIVKHVAQVHGGAIEVQSTPGKGTTFRLKLPVSRSPLATTIGATE